MARGSYVDNLGQLVEDDEDDGGGYFAPEPDYEPGIPPGELFPDEEGRIPPDSTTQGNTESPREIEGPGRDLPVKPPDVQPRVPQPSSSSGDTSGGYTPSQPKTPSPVAGSPGVPSQSPVAYSPLAPMMDPGAMTVAMRAPYMGSPVALPQPSPSPMMDPGASVAMRSPEMGSPTAPSQAQPSLRAPFSSPVSQYGGDIEKSALLGSTEGLLGGGLGLGGGEGFEDTEGEPLDMLLRILLSGQGGGSL